MCPRFKSGSPVAPLISHFVKSTEVGSWENGTEGSPGANELTDLSIESCTEGASGTVNGETVEKRSRPP
jgi:hypothetical protein